MKENANVVDLRRHRIAREIADLQRQLDQLEAVPDLDAFPNETVIRLRVGDRYGHRVLTYVLLKLVIEATVTEVASTRWYFTGTLQDLPRTRWMRSDQLAQWLTDGNRTVESWELMLPDEAFEDQLVVNVKDDTPPGEHRIKKTNGIWVL